MRADWSLTDGFDVAATVLSEELRRLADSFAGSVVDAVRVHWGTSPIANSVSVVSDRSGATIQMVGDVPFYLEFGTVKMAARPFLLPAYERGLGEFGR